MEYMCELYDFFLPVKTSISPDHVEYLIILTGFCSVLFGLQEPLGGLLVIPRSGHHCHSEGTLPHRHLKRRDIESVLHTQPILSCSKLERRYFVQRNDAIVLQILPSMKGFFSTRSCNSCFCRWLYSTLPDWIQISAET